MRASVSLLSIAAVALLAAVAVAQPGPNPKPEELWFKQRFDHFNATDKRTFQQRYLLYKGYYKRDGPLFFTAGGESDVYGGYNHNGFQFELGKSLHAMVLYVEHRFYGETLPLGPVDSYLPGNVEKLSVEQAMADAAAIIKHVLKDEDMPTWTPVVAWGGSYAGELVSYMRAAYPDLIHAAVAGSSPMRYHQGGPIPTGAYYEATTKDFAIANPACPDMVRAAFVQMASSDAQWVAQELGLCSSLEDAGGMRMIEMWVENAYAQLAMLDYPWPNPWGTMLPPYPINSACTTMANSSGSLTHRLGLSVGVLYNSTGSAKCFNVSEEYYPCADLTGCGGGVGDPNSMSWDYQSCTEIISNVDTNNVTDMFPPHPYNYTELTQYCLKRWGAVPVPMYLPNKYNYEAMTRMIHSNGKLDPWWVGGVLEVNASLDQHAIIYEMGAHHLDFYGTDSVYDPEEVTEARKQEREIITRWVKEIKNELHHHTKASIITIIGIAVTLGIIFVAIITLVVIIIKDDRALLRGYRQIS